MAAGQHMPPVRCEVESVDGTGVTVEPPQFLACLHIPQDDHAAGAGRDRLLAVRRGGKGVDLIG